MAAISPEQVAEVVDAGFNLLREAADLTSGRDPNYIRDAQPGNVIDALALAAARQGCRRYQQKGGDYSGRRAARAERACRPYLDSLEPGLGPEIEKPFNGGQCNVAYNITWEQRTQAPGGGFQWTARSRVAPGLIGPLRIVNNSLGTTCPTGQFESRESIVGFDGGGATLLGTGGCGDQQPGYRNLVATRRDGQPDNCGNPDPDFRPPKPPTAPLPPGPQPFVRAPDINVDVDVSVNPDLTINVDIGTGPITIDPFGDAPGGGGGSGGGPGGVGSPGSPEDTGTGGGADGEAPEGQILTGLRIDFVEPPVGGNEYAPGVYRGVCYIYMGTADGLDHDPAGAMLRSGQFVYAEKDFLTRWSVSANAGYNLRVTPYYRPAEAEG